jgi:hypothetical protein
MCHAKNLRLSLQPPDSSAVATMIARSSFLRRSQASVSILCRTSHFAPHMTPTRQSHSAMKGEAFLVVEQCLAWNYAASRSSFTRLPKLLPEPFSSMPRVRHTSLIFSMAWCNPPAIGASAVVSPLFVAAPSGGSTPTQLATPASLWTSMMTSGSRDLRGICWNRRIYQLSTRCYSRVIVRTVLSGAHRAQDSAAPFV